MPWYFYGRTGSLVPPRAPGVLETGTIVPSIIPYTGTPPAGFLFCNGQSVSKTTYLGLFTAIGSIFGPSTISNFTLPNMASRMPRGIVSSASGIGEVPYAAIDGVGGSKTHTHDVGNHQHAMVLSHAHSFATNHTHTYADHRHNMSSHTHSNNTLIGQTTNDIHNSTTPGLDTIEPPDPSYTPSHHATPDVPAHHHSALTGSTGGASNTNLTDLSEGASTTGNQDDNTVSITNLNGSSTPSGSATSTPITQLPPYFTNSFLIKT